jgi:hypothetical protein
MGSAQNYQKANAFETKTVPREAGVFLVRALIAIPVLALASA